MRKTITGTGGMLLLQTLKDAGVEYLFTNPGSAETGIFAALAEDGDQRLVVGKHEGLVAAMADGYHRMSGKVGVIIAHVMGGSFQLAGQLFNAQVAGSSVLVIAGDWTSELQDHRGLAPFPGLMFGDDVWRQGAQAEAVRLAETLEAPVFSTRQIFPNFPTRHPLYCGMYPVAPEFERISGLEPDLLFLVGCQGVHGGVAEPCVMQIGPNPVLMGRHYPLDVAAQCELRGTLRDLGLALTR